MRNLKYGQWVTHEKKIKNKKMYNFIPSETWGKLKWIREQPSYLIDINQD